MSKKILFAVMIALFIQSCNRDDKNSSKIGEKEVESLTEQNTNDDKAIEKYLDEHYLNSQGVVTKFDKTDTRDDNEKKLRKEFSIICNIADLRDFFGDENKLLFEKIKQKLDENTSLDEIKPILHIPILLLYECPITTETTKIDDVYREKIKKRQTDIAKQYFSKQIKKLASIIYDYQHIKFHFILFPVPDKDRIAKKFIRDAQYYGGED